MIDIVIFLSLLTLGYFFGQYFERRHYRSIIEREKETLGLPLLTMKTTPSGLNI